MTVFQTIGLAIAAALIAVGIAIATVVPWLGAWVVVFALILMAMAFVEGKSDDRAKMLRWIDRADNAFLYGALVDWVDATVTRMLSPATAEEKPRPKRLFSGSDWYVEPKARDAADLARLNASAFSWPVTDAALKIAVIYPLVFLLVQWAVTNDPTGIADARPLQPAPWYIRAGATCPVVALVLSKMLAAASPKGVFEKLSDWLYWVTLAGALAAAFAGSATAAFAAAVAFAAALAAAFAGAAAAAGTVALAVALAGALAAAFAGAAALAAAGAVAVAAAFPAVLAVAYAAQSGRAAAGYGALLVCGLGVVSASMIWAGGRIPAEVMIVVFAVGMLPLVNAIFDYLSYGLTLTLLRAGRAEGGVSTFACGVIDIVAAALILYGLSLSLALIIAAINAVSSVPFLPLDRLLSDLGAPETRSGYAWLYLCLLTTLVPTAVHLVLVLLSAMTWVPRKLKRWFLDLIEGPGDLSTLAGTAGFAAVLTTYLILLAIAFRWLIPLIGRNFEDGAMLLLASVSGTLRALGVV